MDFKHYIFFIFRAVRNLWRIIDYQSDIWLDTFWRLKGNVVTLLSLVLKAMNTNSNNKIITG